MTARTWAVALTGLHGHMVDVEADLSQQTPGFELIGLTDRALGEAVSRVHNACKNSGLGLPRRKLTVNLSPASLPKHGAAFDLAIAIAALGTEGTLDPASIARTVHLGELGLDGRLRPIPGVLPALHAAREAGFERVVVPIGNAAEARLVPGLDVHAAVSLAQVALLHGARIDDPGDPDPILIADVPAPPEPGLDLSDVIGQEDAVAALVAAAAGGHHVLLSGPPGVRLIRAVGISCRVGTMLSCFRWTSPTQIPSQAHFCRGRSSLGLRPRGIVSQTAPSGSGAAKGSIVAAETGM